MIFSKLKNFYLLQNTEIKNIFLIILVITFAIGLIEMIGVGIIFPALKFFADDSYRLQFIEIFDRLGIQSTNSKNLFFFVALISFFAMKNVFLSFLVYWQYKLTGYIRHQISCNLFKKYLYSKYDFYMQNNTSEITKNLTTTINLFNANILIPLSILFSEFFILILLILLALYLNFYGSLILFFLILFPVFFYVKFLRSKLKRYGTIFHENESYRIKCINEMTGSIKEIKILDKESFFFDKYKNFDQAIVGSFLKSTIFNQVTKFFLEFNLVIAVLIFIFYELLKNQSINELLPYLGFYAVTAFKIIPSINRIIISFQQLKFAEPILETINNELKNNTFNLNNGKKNIHSFKASLKIKNLSYGYKPDSLILQKLNINIKKGDVIGICGKTGSGKSTFINLLLGLIDPIDGEIVIDNNLINNKNKLKNFFGYVPQDIFLLDDTIVNNVAFGCKNVDINKKRVCWALKKSGLNDFVKSLNDGINTLVGERGIRISGGQKQRIGIARALYLGAKILIFDEATSSLDNKTEKYIMKNIADLKDSYTIIMVAHRESTLYFCNKIYDLKNKQLNQRIA